MSPGTKSFLPSSVTAMIRSKPSLLILLLVVTTLSGSSTISAARGAVSARPISDFVSTQGTFCLDDGFGGCLIFNPPVANFLGWTVAGETLLASVDYAGLADRAIQAASGKSLGTTTDGTITERLLPDGRAEVTVLLQTGNALTWVAEDFGTGALLFGHRATVVLAGADAALGESFLHLVFINPGPGVPLPDLLQLFFTPSPGQELKFISFHSQSIGTFRAASGIPDGSKGRAIVTQTGLFMTKFKGATADAFPAERIQLRAIGR
jgi:hypothetical protein